MPDTKGTRPLTISIPYKYTEEVIPKRCRKPRRMQFEARITLTIHSVSSSDAPVAIVHHWKDFGEYDTVPAQTVYRWWGKRLWTRYVIQRVCHGPKEAQTLEQFAADPYPYTLDKPAHNDYRWFNSQRERRASFRRWARSILFIDGERWEEAGEPRYVVMTFGLGCNHGLGHGTDLSTDTSYNSNIGRSRYFRIDQFEQAVAETTRIALARGDTKAVPVIEKQDPDRFDILIPAAVRLQPRKEHGTGCAFINQIESVIESVQHPTIAGVLGMALAFKGSEAI